MTKNFSYVFLARVTTMLLATGAMIFLIRYLGPVQLGIYSYVVSIMGLLGIFADCGIGLNLIGWISKDKSTVGKYLINHIAIQVIISLVFLLGLLVFISFEQQVLVRKLIMISSIGLVFSNLHIPFATVLNGLENMKYSFYLSILSGGATFIIILIGIYFSLDLTYFIILTVTPGFISFLVTFFFAKKYIEFASFSWPQMKRIFLAGLPYFVLVSGGILYSKIDILMLKYLSTDTDVGLYSAAYKIIFMLNIIPITLTSALYPMLSNYFHNSENKVEYILAKLSKYLLICSILICCYVYYYAFELINLLLGANFAFSGIALKLLILSFVPNCMCVVMNNYYLAAGRVKRMSIIYISGSIINIVLNYYLIPSFSLYGAAFSTVLCEFIILIFYYSMIVRKYPKFVKDIDIVKISLIAAISFICIDFVDNHYFAMFFAICFLGILYLINVITKEEIAILNSTLRYFLKKIKTNKSELK